MSNIADNHSKPDHVRQMIATGNWQLGELSIEVTNECLVRCIHCSSGAQPRKMKNELTFEEHKRIMREARDLGATVLSLSGGDPILVPTLVDLLRYADEVGFEKILLYTTGIRKVDLDIVDWNVRPLGLWGGVHGISSHSELTDLLDDSADALLDKLTFIFSLHSHIPSVNDYIMNMPGAHKVITRSMKYLTGVLGASVQTHFVPMRPNIQHVSKTRNLCVELGVAKMSLLRFVPQTRGFANASQLLPDVELFDLLQAEIDYEMSNSDRVGLPCSIRTGCPIDFRHAVPGTSIHQAGTGKPKSCHAGTDLILVRPTGTVHPCAAWKSLPQDSNVRVQSLKDIWEGDATFNAIRHYLQDGYKGLAGACESCPSLSSCRGGCPAQRLHAFGRKIEDLYYPEADPLCPTRLHNPVRHNAAYRMYHGS